MSLAYKNIINMDIFFTRSVHQGYFQLTCLQVLHADMSNFIMPHRHQ